MLIYAIRHRAAHLNLLFEISSLCNERNNGTLAAAAATATAAATAAAAATRTNSARQVKLGFPIRMPLTCAVVTETEAETAEPSPRDSQKIDKDRQSRLPKS